MTRFGFIFLLTLLLAASAFAQNTRTLSGRIVTSNNESVAGALVTVNTTSGEQQTTSNQAGAFSLGFSGEALTIKVTGKNLVTLE